jgi:hypothetical protein
LERVWGEEAAGGTHKAMSFELRARHSWIRSSSSSSSSSVKLSLHRIVCEGDDYGEADRGEGSEKRGRGRNKGGGRVRSCPRGWTGDRR